MRLCRYYFCTKGRKTMRNIMDKRVLKTRNLIKMTVAGMLKNKNIDDISVSDIAAQSLIQRATFYNHYSSVYDVVLDIWADITDLAAEQFEGVDFTAIRRSVTDIFIHISHTYHALPPEYREFISSENPVALNGIRKWFTENTINKVEQKQRKLTEFEKYSARMFLNGIIDSYFAWKEACPDEKKRDIYEFIGYASRVADNACSFIGIE